MAVTLGWSAQGRMLTPLEWVTTTVFEHVDAIFSTSSPFQSEWREVRSSPSVAQLFRRTRQTSGVDGSKALRLVCISLVSAWGCGGVIQLWTVLFDDSAVVRHVLHKSLLSEVSALLDCLQRTD